MEVTSEQIVEALNLRAASDPLIKEILRSTMYEVVLRAQQEAAQEEPTKEDE